MSSPTGRGSFLHSIKAKVFSGGASGIPENEYFEDLEKQFRVLNGALNNLRTHLTGFQNGVKTLFSQSSACTADFGEILPGQHNYTNVCSDMKSGHANLTAVKTGEPAISKTLEENCNRKINDELAEHAKIFKMLDERKVLKADYDYYFKKVAELKAEKDKRATKGKAEGAKDIEKWDRNQGKLAECTAKYENHNRITMEEIQKLLERKVETFAAAMMQFIASERQIAQVFTDALKTISNPEQPIAAIDTSPISPTSQTQVTPSPQTEDIKAN
jgi:molecular chaperone GrpE (heat shock protein)